MGVDNINKFNANEIFSMDTHAGQHARIISDSVHGRDGAAGAAVAPAVIDQQLSAARLEGREVRIHRFHETGALLGEGSVAVEIEGAPVPVGVLVGDVAEDAQVD